MAEINTTNHNKNIVELRSELGANGTKMENVYVDGKKFCCVGYVNEKDKQACLKAIQTAVDGSENLYEAMMKLMTIANLGDKEVVPDEQVNVNGYEVLISYEKRAAYDHNGDEICNCRELECELAPEAIKAILTPRVEAALAEDDECDDCSVTVESITTSKSHYWPY